MAGIFGIEGTPAAGTPEYWLRQVTRTLLYASTLPVAQLGELMNIGKDEPVGIQRAGLELLDRPTYAVIKARRREAGVEDRRDILSLLIGATTEDGETLTDHELRNELLTLVLAGHETTANQLSWTWERLVRNPDAHDRLVAAVREGSEEEGAAVVEQTLNESMRNRPVIPIIGRRVMVPWRLGEYGVAADTPVTMSILLVHHREDLYPDPYSFRPERWVGHKPGTYEWIPFGGGIRRCLGASLAMAEQRIVLEAMARRLDVEFAEPEPEKALHRNVTMIPAQGATVVVRGRR
jgi:cytochrome P450